MFRARGVIPAMVTPFRGDDVDVESLRQLTKYLIRSGVHGLFCAGSQGESYALAYNERQVIIETVVDESDGQLPVFAGTGSITTQESIKLTQMAERAGADAVTVITPYFISPSTDELYEHYSAIARSTRLPVYLYGNPARTNVPLPTSLVRSLSKIDNVRGIKDSTGDLSQTMSYLAATTDDFDVLMGRDTLIYAALCCGARGAVAATANVAPALAASIYNRFIEGDYAGSLESQRALEPLRVAFGLGTFPVVVKEALTMIGIPMGPCRLPVGPMPEGKKEELRKVLLRMKLT